MKVVIPQSTMFLYKRSKEPFTFDHPQIVDLILKGSMVFFQANANEQ